MHTILQNIRIYIIHCDFKKNTLHRSKDFSSNAEINFELKKKIKEQMDKKNNLEEGYDHILLFFITQLLCHNIIVLS